MKLLLLFIFLQNKQLWISALFQISSVIRHKLIFLLWYSFVVFDGVWLVMNFQFPFLDFIFGMLPFSVIVLRIIPTQVLAMNS